MSEDHGNDEQELRRLRSEVAAQRRDIHDLDDLEHRQEELIARLREEAAVREGDLAALRERVAAAEHELEDLRAIRDALTPPELPRRPGLELAAAFLPAIAEQVSGDFYLVAEGPQDSTVLVVGDVVGHGLQAARRAAFIRTTFAATAPFSDDPCRLLSWANTALIERAGVSVEFVTAACVTFLPSKQILRWAYAGHPPALWLDDGHELIAARQGTPLGLGPDPGFVEGSQRATVGAGVLLYTDGLTEARHDGQKFGLPRYRTSTRCAIRRRWTARTPRRRGTRCAARTATAFADALGMAADTRPIRKSMTLCKTGSSWLPEGSAAATRRQAGARSQPLVPIDTSYSL